MPAVPGAGTPMVFTLDSIEIVAFFSIRAALWFGPSLFIKAEEVFKPSVRLVWLPLGATRFLFFSRSSNRPIFSTVLTCY